MGRPFKGTGDVVVVFYDLDVLLDDAVVVGELASQHCLLLLRVAVEQLVVCLQQVVYLPTHCAPALQSQTHSLRLHPNKIIF